MTNWTAVGLGFAAVWAAFLGQEIIGASLVVALFCTL